MKKFLVIGGIAAVVIMVAAFFGVAYVSAQSPTPGVPAFGGGRGYMMGGSQPMAEYMHAALADKLGLSEQEFEDQLAQGKTAWQLADEKGFTQEEITTLMTDARSEALDQMVAEGVITQEQAEWMKTRGGAMMGGTGRSGMGAGGCPMLDGDENPGASFEGGRGRGRGMMGGIW